ncbi:MAG: helix-turn-helix domain-containing protein [Candidatus Woesearchaeota archaeon]
MIISFACQDIDFKDLLRCSFNLNKTEYNVMMFLLKTNQSFTTTKLAEVMKLDRTTVQKAIKKLADKEIVSRYQENLDKGGYLFHYKIYNKEAIKERMLQIVNKWHEAVVEEIKRW